MLFGHSFVDAYARNKDGSAYKGALTTNEAVERGVHLVCDNYKCGARYSILQREAFRQHLRKKHGVNSRVGKPKQEVYGGISFCAIVLSVLPSLTNPTC